jgi:hypothetical protein
MVWLGRRFLVPFAVGSAVCAILLLVWTIFPSDTEVRINLQDFAFTVLLILPFQVAGLCLFVPVALLLSDLSLPKPIYPILLVVVGAILGSVVVLPVSERPYFLDVTLAASCGALSAVIWLAFNRDVVKLRA